MDELYNGGPAFPLSEATVFDRIENKGMTLRDWFAGQALAIVYSRFPQGSDPKPEDLALQAYFIADAMLAEREGL